MSNSMLMCNWTGKKTGKAPTADNMAVVFDPLQPMCGPDYDANRMVVLTDVPVKLQKALDEGLEVIGKKCLPQGTTQE